MTRHPDSRLHRESEDCLPSRRVRRAALPVCAKRCQADLLRNASFDFGPSHKRL